MRLEKQIPVHIITVKKKLNNKNVLPLMQIGRL